MALLGILLVILAVIVFAGIVPYILALATEWVAVNWLHATVMPDFWLIFAFWFVICMFIRGAASRK